MKKPINLEELFEELLSHLNAEDNDMALEFAENLAIAVRIIDEEWGDAGNQIAQVKSYS